MKTILTFLLVMLSPLALFAQPWPGQGVTVRATNGFGANFTGLNTTNAGLMSGTPERMISDYRALNYDLARTLGMPFRQPQYQHIVWDTGQNLPHSLVYVRASTGTNYVFSVSSQTAPAILIRHDASDITNRTILTFVSDGHHDDCGDLQLGPDGNLYAIFSSATGNTNIMITRINPVTLATNDVVNVRNFGAGNGPPALAIDNQNFLYAFSRTGFDTFTGIGKFSTNGSIVVTNMINNTATITNGSDPHSLRFDGKDLYASGNTTARVWFMKISTNDLSTLISTATTSFNNTTDDFAEAGDFCYFGTEDLSGVVVRADKRDGSFAYINTGLQGARLYAVAYDGYFLWSLHAFTNGIMTRFDPVTWEAARYALSTNEFAPNEFATDGQSFFITSFSSPGRLSKIGIPSGSGDWYGLLNTNGTLSMSVSNGVATQNSSIAAGTVASGVILSNTALATSGNQRYGPFFESHGHGWKSIGGSSIPVGFRWGTIPIQGAQGPTATLTYQTISNGTATTVGSLSQAGTLTVNGGFTAGTTITAPNSLITSNVASYFFGDGSGISNVTAAVKRYFRARSDGARHSYNIGVAVSSSALSNWVNITSNQFNYNLGTGSVTNQVAGNYTLTGNVTIDGLGTDTGTAFFRTNGVAAGAECEFVGAANTYYPFVVGPQEFFLPANCRIEFVVEHTVGGVITSFDTLHQAFEVVQSEQ